MLFRRKARRAGSPVVICPDGASRSGTYTLIDAVICGYGQVFSNENKANDIPVSTIHINWGSSLYNQWKHFKRNGKEPKPSNLLMSLRGQRMKAIKNMNQLNFVTEGTLSYHY